MFTNVLRSRAIARLAVAALAVGLLVLAGIALVGENQARNSGARISKINQIGSHWELLTAHLNAQDTALKDFGMSAGDKVAGLRVVSGTKLVTGDLGWLQAHDEAGKFSYLALCIDTYARVRSTGCLSVRMRSGSCPTRCACRRSGQSPPAAPRSTWK
jgi:hypothetical protein